MGGTDGRIPDVLLLDVNEAARLLDSAGLSFRVVETEAPGKKAQDGRLRVIRLRADGGSGGVELTVCRM
jgi:beta-lactam-binding protein with PASTA domain